MFIVGDFVKSEEQHVSPCLILKLLQNACLSWASGPWTYSDGSSSFKQGRFNRCQGAMLPCNSGCEGAKLAAIARNSCRASFIMRT